MTGYIPRGSLKAAVKGKLRWSGPGKSSPHPDYDEENQASRVQGQKHMLLTLIFSQKGEL